MNPFDAATLDDDDGDLPDILGADDNESEYRFINLPKEKLLIKMSQNTNSEDREEIIDLIQTILDTDMTYVSDTKKQ